jgi:hypothetical protein
MKLQTIIEDKLTDMAAKLNKSLYRYGEDDLHYLVNNPGKTVDMIRSGATSKKFILANRDWVERFLDQWRMISLNERERMLDETVKEVIAHLERMQRDSQSDPTRKEAIFRNDLVLSEGIGSFLATLAKWAILVMKLLVASGGGHGGYGGYGGRGGRGGRGDAAGGAAGGRKTVDELRILNPYAVFKLTKRLRDASQIVYDDNEARKRQELQSRSQQPTHKPARSQAPSGLPIPGSAAASQARIDAANKP